MLRLDLKKRQYFLVALSRRTSNQGTYAERKEGKEKLTSAIHSAQSPSYESGRGQETCVFVSKYTRMHTTSSAH
jgi:hypothetical protein